MTDGAPVYGEALTTAYATGVAVQVDQTYIYARPRAIDRKCLAFCLMHAVIGHGQNMLLTSMFAQRANASSVSEHNGWRSRSTAGLLLTDTLCWPCHARVTGTNVICTLPYERPVDEPDEYSTLPDANTNADATANHTQGYDGELTEAGHYSQGYDGELTDAGHYSKATMAS